MRRLPAMIVMVLTPLLTAAFWMDRQPSYKPFQAPVLAPPASAVPVGGKETVTPDSVPKNPVSPTPASRGRGEGLFGINCAMCHGRTSAERGPVGKRLNPPPPGLGRDMVGGLSDPDIFKAITFGFGRMPPFRDKLRPGERWDLVNYLRSRK